MPVAPARRGAVTAERAQLDLFRSVGGNLAPRDAQDLMAWPFFSLAKSRRVAPIDFRMGETWIVGGSDRPSMAWRPSGTPTC